MFLHGAVPCTPWSSWQHINLAKHESLRARIDSDRCDSVKLVRGFVRLALLVASCGGLFSFEWPKGATGWVDHRVVRLLGLLKTYKAEVHGCAVYMRGKGGGLMFKPWRIECSTKVQAQFLDTFRCTCKAKHVPCEGGFTKSSGTYSFMMARTLLKSFKLALWFVESSDNETHSIALPVVLASAPVLAPDVPVASEVVPFDLTAFACLDEETNEKSTQVKHREKFSMPFCWCLWCLHCKADAELEKQPERCAGQPR